MPPHLFSLVHSLLTPSPPLPLCPSMSLHQTQVAALGSRLILRRATDTVEELSALVAETGAQVGGEVGGEVGETCV